MDIKKIIRLSNRLAKEMSEGVIGVRNERSGAEVHMSFDGLVKTKSLKELDVAEGWSVKYHELSYKVGSTKIFALASDKEIEALKNESEVKVNE